METAETLGHGRAALLSMQLAGFGAVALRPLAFDDLPAMQRLLGRCDASRSESTIETIIRSLDWRPASASTLTLGAIDDQSSRLVGLAGLTADRRIEAGARFGLLVDPDCRQLGVGNALLAALIRAAEGAGYRFLSARASHGEGAIRALARTHGLALRRTDGLEPFVLERSLGAPRPASG